MPKQAATVPKVDHIRSEVEDALPKWELIRHCLAGQQAIKAERTKYLVQPNASDPSQENKDRYNARLARAVFYNATGRTHEGLVGQVFARDPSTDLPPTLEPFIKNVDGGGVPMDQQSKRALGLVLGYGRAGLLVDYPLSAPLNGEAATPTTRAQLLEGKVRPTLLLYNPWDIINWRTRVVGSETLLSLVVLREQFLKEDDGFVATYGEQIRVLRLDDTSNTYTIEIYQKAEKSWEQVSSVVATDHKGQPLPFIPFTFIGCENNDSEMDEPPLLDLANLNIAHYNDSADYQDSIFYVGQPMYYFAGLTEQWVEKVMKGGVRVGSSQAVLLPQGGAAGIVQAEPNTLAKEGMEHKEKQMRAIGARFVEDRAVQRTATEAAQDETSETSILTSSANNVSSAYTKALGWAALFVGETNVSDEALAYQLNTDLAVSRMTSQDRQQLIAEWQGGGMTWKEYRWNMRRSGLVYEDDDDAREEIAADIGDTGSGAGSGPADNDPNSDDQPEDDA